MRVKVVQVGNSRGIRLPQVILQQCGVEDALELEVDGRKLVLVPIPATARNGWEAAAERMARSGDDVALLPDTLLDDVDLEW